MVMAVSKLLANQLGNPTGIFGKLAPWVWNRRNAALNDTVFKLLALQPADRVLEIGFGGGYLLNRMGASLTNGFLTGIDISPAMVAHAEKHCQEAIQAGRLELKCAPAESLPYPDRHFTKVCSVNTIFYWEDIRCGLGEIWRVLERGGIVIICFTDKGSLEQKGFAREIKLFVGADVQGLLEEVGFQDTEVLSFADRYRQYRCVGAQKR
jgi:arsenite methyltransferase